MTIEVVLLIVAIIALGFNAWAVLLQRRAVDFSNYLELSKRFSDGWRRLLDFQKSEVLDLKFEVGEVLNTIESGCHIYNEGLVGKASKEMIEHLLVEVIHNTFNGDRIKTEVIHSYISGPDTFLEIKKFAKKFKIETNLDK